MFSPTKRILRPNNGLLGIVRWLLGGADLQIALPSERELCDYLFNPACRVDRELDPRRQQLSFSSRC